MGRWSPICLRHRAWTTRRGLLVQLICLAAVYEPEFALPWQILMFGARVQILNSESGLYKTTKGRLQ